MILSAQTIRRYALEGMIHPFYERERFAGKTFGLGPCTYDFTLSWPLTNPLKLGPSQFILVSTRERLALPNHICASVLDKSSWARLGLSVFNTHFDPGFEGFPTIELANVGQNILEFTDGTPLCQFKFEELDLPTEQPYNGKYQNQPPRPVGSIDE